MNNEIDAIINEIAEYQKIHGEDKQCLLAKANLFATIGEDNESVACLKKALKLDAHDVDILYSLGAELEKIGDLAASYVYFGMAAREAKKQNMTERYKQIINEFSNSEVKCKEIFETVAYTEPRTFIYLSNSGYGAEKQRFQILSENLGKLGNRVIFVCFPQNLHSSHIPNSDTITNESLALYSLSNVKSIDGIMVVPTFCDTTRNISGYPSVVSTLVDRYENAVLIVSNPLASAVVKRYKGKNKIIFECVDDNSDYKSAYWTSENSYKNELELCNIADDITCTAASLFLKKALVSNHTSVHFSPNAVSAEEFKYGLNSSEPDDIKNIPHPRIGYAGVIYQRFDRELFYNLAKKNPDKSFIIIGSIINDYVVKKYDNIYILGNKPHAELEAYYKNMDICIVPYLDTAKMSMACDPIKIHEHICCGVPTITTYMPDTAIDRPMVYHGNTLEEFQKHIDDILFAPPSLSKDDIELYILHNSWLSRACHIMRIASDKLYEYENTENTVSIIRENFRKIKDLHPNFRIIYALSLWNDNIELCQKEVETACRDCTNDFHIEIKEWLNNRVTFTTKNGKTIQANNINLINKENCYGCTACKYSCSKNAISMKPDNLGFLYPEINYNLCINCGVCVKHCPVSNSLTVGHETSEFFAAMAPNNVRRESTSGGVFTLLASHTLDEGGYVAGAVFNENFGVEHIVTNNISEIIKMRGSKYVQSSMNSTYYKVKEFLKGGHPVLFTGCPCQVAGLYSYLGENPDKLLTMSFVCAGVPSPKIFKEHLNNITKEGTRISQVSFRDKAKFGWNTGLSVRFDDNSEYVALASSDKYTSNFLSGTIIRDSCHNCAFKNDLYSDITVGDFWGINNLLQFDDGLGTSYISVNSTKGEAAIKNCSLDFIKMAKAVKKHAIAFNPRIREPMPRPAYKQRFIENYVNLNDFTAAYDETFTKNKYDAVLVLWWSSNYGNALTNYALYHTLSSVMKLNVIAADNVTIAPCNQFREFADRHFVLSSQHFPQGCKEFIAQCSDNFIVGSDQVWNTDFSLMMGHSGYFQLKFIPDEKNKISYGSSFGHSTNAVDKKRFDYYKNLYSRFNAISLRENFGVKIMQDVYDIKATYVLDPVFLPTKNDYIELAKQAGCKEKAPFIVSYILNPTEQKKQYLQKLQDKLGVEIINILDAEPVRTELNIKNFDIGKLKPKLTPEEFVYYFANCDFVMTDSYHGTCFSLIFEKRFVSFMNRESDRFETFREFEEIKNRVYSSVPDNVDDLLLNSIDYNSINEKLSKLRTTSFDYLEKAIKK